MRTSIAGYVNKYTVFTWLLLFATPALAKEVPVDLPPDATIGTAGLHIGGANLPKGTILSSRFRPDHNLRIDSIDFVFWGTPNQDIELHLWTDNGGYQPGAPGGLLTDNPDSDYVAPTIVKTGANGEVVTWTLPANAPTLQAKQVFWIGAKILNEGTCVAIDGIDATIGELTMTAMLQTPDGTVNNVCVDSCMVPGHLVIQLHGHYIDPLDKFWFTDITALAGIQAGGRMAIGDYDNDGDDDVLYGGAVLYRNDGKGHFDDVSATAGTSAFGGSGALWGDFDNDGWLDIWVFGGTEHLLHNTGKGTFVEVGVGTFFDSDKYPTEGSILVDFDNDGLLDIYDANYEWYHKDAAGNDVLSDCGYDFLWHNKGNLEFEEIGQQVGIRKGPYCGRGLAAMDWDQDGDSDLFVNNYRLNPDFFFRNDTPPLKMTDIAKKLGVKGSGAQGAFGHGTGTQWVDADNDGDFDLFAANLAHPRFIAFSDKSHFWRNEGSDGAFALTDLRTATGVAYAETQSTPAFADFDNDGDMDMVAGAYYGERMGQFWRNDGNTGDPATWLAFSDRTYESNWLAFGCASIAWADFDGDGDLDNFANNQLFRNDYNTVSGTSGHYLKVRLHGSKAVNRAAIGAWVTVDTGDGQIRSRLVSGGQGLSTQDSLTLFFGLGSASQVQSLVVHWPGIAAETFGPFAVDSLVEITEGSQPTRTRLGAPDAGSSDAAGSKDASSSEGLSGEVSASTQPASSASSAKSSGCSAQRSATPLSLLSVLVLAALGLMLGKRRLIRKR